MKPDEQKIIAEKKLHDMMQKVMGSRDEGVTEEEKHRFFEIAAGKYDAMGEMACALGILNPRDVDLISQYESQEWFASHRDDAKIQERNETSQNKQFKVLIEVDEARLSEIKGILAKPEIGGKILGTEKNMALDTVFSAEDVWDLVANPEDNFNAFQPFDKEELSNIESYGRKKFLEAVISRLNHGFDAEDGVTWYTIKNTAEDAYEDLVLDREKTEEVEHISTDGLRTALRRYNENGKRGECGPWEIHDGGYNRWWEISYAGKVLVACYASGEYGDSAREFGNMRELGNIVRERQLSDKVFSDICKIVSEEFQECRMVPEEQKKIAEKIQSVGR